MPEVKKDDMDLPPLQILHKEMTEVVWCVSQPFQAQTLEANSLIATGNGSVFNAKHPCRIFSFCEGREGALYPR